MTIRTHALPAIWRAALICIAVVAIFAFIIPAAAAHATQPSPSYVTAVWFAKGTNQWPAEGQTLLASKKTTGTPLDVQYVKEQATTLGCGYTIQGDGYADDRITNALLTGGKLYGPSNPQESWPGGSYKSEYSTVFYTGDCPPPAPEQPADKVTVEKAEAVNCVTDVIDITITTTTTTTTLVDNVWVWQEPTVVVTHDTRALSPEQLADCHPVIVPEQPDPKVTSEVADVQNCVDGTVTRTTTTTTIPPVLVENEWVDGEPEVVVTVEVLAIEDVDTAEPCPTSPPEPTCAAGEEVSNGVCMPADEADPTLQPQPHSLATTGVDLTIPSLVAGLLAIAGAIVLLAKRRKPRTADESIDDHSDILPRI